MTGEDHNSEAFIAALRSPALPAERAGEATAVSAMIEAQASVSAAPPGSRSRRGVAIAAVTVASLGLGGLAAAGPGIFSPAADQPDELPPPAVAAVEQPGEQQSTNELGASSIQRSDPPDSGTPRIGDVTEEAEVECADGNHGDTVSSVAQSADPEDGKGDEVSAAARSDCGKAKPSSEGDAPGRSGDAPGQTGDTPGQSGDTPGQTGDTPGQSGDTPGQTGDSPGQSGDTPGQTGEAPGQSGEAPGQSGDSPGQGGKKNKDD